MRRLMMFAALLGSTGLGISSGWAATELAKVNAKTITEADLKGAVSGLNEIQAKELLNQAASRRQLLNSLIEQELLVQKGETDKIDQSAEYKTALNAFRRQYIVNAVLEKDLKAKLNDKATRKYYDDNKMQFATDQARAWHILSKTESEAKDMLKKAKEKDADFQALAEKYSQDPSAKNNRGDLGYFTRDRMVHDFSEAVFNAKPGQIIGPIKTEFGYHIIKVVDQKPGKIPGYDEVELQVKNAYRQYLIENYVSDLRKKAKIEISAK